MDSIHSHRINETQQQQQQKRKINQPVIHVCVQHAPNGDSPLGDVFCQNFDMFSYQHH